jgi:hypothetical protein
MTIGLFPTVISVSLLLALTMFFFPVARSTNSLPRFQGSLDMPLGNPINPLPEPRGPPDIPRPESANPPPQPKGPRDIPGANPIHPLPPPRRPPDLPRPEAANPLPQPREFGNIPGPESGNSLSPPRGLADAPTVLCSFFLATDQSTRIAVLHEYIRNATIPSTVTFRYWFVNATRENNTEAHTLVPSDAYRAIVARSDGNKDMDLAMKFWFCMRFFLEDPQVRWLYRGNDDTLLNFRVIGDYFLQLERSYDPLKDIVVLGNCVRHDEWLYPQGGSGYLLSRAAVRLIEPLRDLYVEKWPGPEDMNMGPFWASLNISMTSVASSAFMGHTFSNEVLLKIREKKWSEFPTCPRLDLLPPEPCGRFLEPLNNLVFFHQYDGQWPWPMENARAMFGAPPDLYWYPGPGACRTSDRALLEMYPGWTKGKTRVAM